MKDLTLLPIGQQDFGELRRNNLLYVDKTSFILKMLRHGSVFFFLARPRRFGKSLLVSTLKAIFEGKKELFSNLFIEDKITWQKYPVLHFDFSKMGFREIGLYPSISKRLLEIAQNYGISLQNEALGLQFAELIQQLELKTGQKVVILIDEYDKPITDVLEVGKNQQAHEHRNILRSFYSILKGNSEHIRFFFMTGVARFSKVSIFSDLNHLTDLSSHQVFHNLLGYTQQEVETYFEAHLSSIAQEQAISLQALLEKVKYWYNGFSWNGKEKLYNPFSVLKFLDAREFKNFWFESGTPQFLIWHLKQKMIYRPAPIEVLEEETESFDIDNLNIETLFFQTGYLTLKAFDSVGRWILDYPNKEVEISMTRHILQAFAHTPKSSMALDITLAIQKHDMDLLIHTINVLFASIPYQIFDQHQEKYFHAVLFLSLKLCGFFVTSEVSVAQGRIDAVMIYEKRVYIFEFKLNDSAENALKQIHQKAYYEAYLDKNYEMIYLLGIGFSSKTKQVETWSIEKL